ncbi:hypothetical protein ACS0TY_002856 [Phlomoides rotata]
MEISSFRSLADHLGMEDPLFFQQWPADSMDDMSNILSAFSQDYHDHHHHHSYNSQLDFKRPSESSPVAEARPLKMPRTTNWDPAACKPDQKSVLNSSTVAVGVKEEAWYSSSPLTNFPASQSPIGNQNYVLKACQGVKRVSTNTRQLAQAQDHILAERKRREKLSQRFIALSALVPGLKKVINYFSLQISCLQSPYSISCSIFKYVPLLQHACMLYVFRWTRLLFLVMQLST